MQLSYGDGEAAGERMRIRREMPSAPMERALPRRAMMKSPVCAQMPFESTNRSISRRRMFPAAEALRLRRA